MKIKTIVALASTLMLSNVYAEETYRVEAVTQLTTLKDDNPVNQRTTTLGAAYYLKDIVIDHSQPYAEMDFLQKAGYVAGSINNVSYEDNQTLKTTITPIALKGQFYVNDFSFGLGTSTWGPSNLNFKQSPSHYMAIKENNTSFNVGYFVMPTTLLSFGNNKQTQEYTPSAGVDPQTTLNVTTTQLYSHTVKSLGDMQSLVLDLAYSQIKRQQDVNQTNRAYSANIRFYPVPRYYFEGGYKSNTGDHTDDKGTTYSFGGGYAFTERFGVLLSASKFTVSDTVNNHTSNNTMSLTAGYRF